MTTIISKRLDGKKLEKVVEIIRSVGFPVFDMELGRDEVAENKSFFLYNEKGDIRPTERRNQYKQDFVLMFVSRDGKQIDEISLIEPLRDAGLIFDQMDHSEGRLLDTDDKAEVLTFNFHYPVLIDR